MTASLDLSDAFDGLFFDTVLVLRRVESISQFGRRQPVAPFYNVVQAVVTPVSSRTTRDADYQVADGDVEVSTLFRLRGPTGGYQADVVVLDNADDPQTPLVERYAQTPTAFEHYVVADLKDLSRFGSGFFVATCSLTDLVPEPPVDQEISEC